MQPTVRTHPVLIGGRWRPSLAPPGDLHAFDPARGTPLEERYPISGWPDLEAALSAAQAAAERLGQLPAEARAEFLEGYALRLEANRERLVATAAQETGLPLEPRLNSNELPRTVDQLRQAARAVRERTWTQPVLDTARNLRALRGPLGGAVLVFGPNNFPLAFNAVSGSDFAGAVAAGNPVIAKGHPLHPATTRALAELALEALLGSGLPAATLQLVYHFPPELTPALVAHPAVACVSFTGSRAAGLAIKAAADRAHKPFYAELSSVNPVFVLPGALEERSERIADEFLASCTTGSGQLCTNPGLVILPSGPVGERFAALARERFERQAPGVLLSAAGLRSLEAAVQGLIAAGATLLTGGTRRQPGWRYSNTLLRVNARAFLEAPEAFQTEAFGPVSLLVFADPQRMPEVARALEGNLTGTIYAHSGERDDALHAALSALLRPKVGRLANDHMPTSARVSAAMQHGGPFPATTHPGFTAVGIPASITRFTALQCYDNWRDSRLPPELQDANPLGIWRWVEGVWTREGVNGRAQSRSK